MTPKIQKFILQMIPVAAAIIALLTMTPWRLLPSKEKLETTPVTLESVRALGQLVTAEYSGEVIATEEANDTILQSTPTGSHQLLAIGRGRVKAGIDFGRFTEHNFRYDRAHQRIYLLNTPVVILESSINPWYVPEKKIPGFEILIATGSATDLKSVKNNCLIKLRKQAVANGVLELATAEATSSLEIFFSILVGERVRLVVQKGKESDP